MPFCIYLWDQSRLGSSNCLFLRWDHLMWIYREPHFVYWFTRFTCALNATIEHLPIEKLHFAFSTKQLAKVLRDLYDSIPLAIFYPSCCTGIWAIIHCDDSTPILVSYIKKGFELNAGWISVPGQVCWIDRDITWGAHSSLYICDVIRTTIMILAITIVKIVIITMIRMKILLVMIVGPPDSIL